VVEVRVPAAALEDEVAARDEAHELLLGALGAGRELGLGDALLDGQLVPAVVTSVLVRRHLGSSGRAGE
jgi:hypothetical protein